MTLEEYLKEVKERYSNAKKNCDPFEYARIASDNVPALVEMVVRMHNYIKSSRQMYPNEKDLENLESLIPTKEGE